jgi:hypothetical protein
VVKKKDPPRRAREFSVEDAIVRFFEVERRYELPDAIKQVELLIEILEAKARDLHVEASRRMSFPIYLCKSEEPANVVDDLRCEFARNGLERDAFARRALNRIRKRRHVTAAPRTSAEFLRLASAVDREVRRERGGLRLHMNELQKLRSTHGRSPSVAMEILLRWAEGEGIGTTALARLLSDRDVIPPGYNVDDPNGDTAFARWEVVIKAARARHRRRTRVTK